MVINTSITNYSYIKTTFKSVNLFINHLSNKLDELSLNNRDCMYIKLCVIEALANAILWGNKQDPAKIIYLQYTIEQNYFSISIEDVGPGFDVSKLDTSLNHTDPLRESGRGILFMRNFMDNVVYNKKGNKVTLELIRK